MLRHLAFLIHQVEDDAVHEVDEEDGALDNVLLRLRQVSGRVPAGLYEEEVM